MNADEIVFARPKTTGVFFAGATSATMPTDASTAIGSAFTEIGYVSNSGIVQTIDRSVVNLQDMGGDVVKILDESHSVQYRLTPLQFNQAVLTELFGSTNVTTDANGDVTAVAVNSTPLSDRSFIFDMLLSDQRMMRIVVPVGHLTATGDMTFRAGIVLNAEFTITAMPDSSGNKAYYYFA